MPRIRGDVKSRRRRRLAHTSNQTPNLLQLLHHLHLFMAYKCPETLSQTLLKLVFVFGTGVKKLLFSSSAKFSSHTLVEQASSRPPPSCDMSGKHSKFASSRLSLSDRLRHKWRRKGTESFREISAQIVWLIYLLRRNSSNELLQLPRSETIGWDVALSFFWTLWTRPAFLREKNGFSQVPLPEPYVDW